MTTPLPSERRRADQPSRPVRCAAGTLLAVALLVSLTILGCAQDEEASTNIGIVLPRTGELAYLGDNVEGAVIVAANAINDAGGVLGRPLRLRLGDTHSDLEQGLERMQEMIDSDVLALIGPKNEDLAKRSVPLLKHNRLMQISGGVSSPTLSTADDGDFWFRTCPSSRIYGRALTARMFADGVRTVSVLHVNDEYGFGFASVVASEFANLGGTIIGPGLGAPISFGPGKTSYRDIVADALAGAPDAFVLVADDLTGATLVGDSVILGGSVRWYLAPSLRSAAFLQRIPSGFLEGAVGVGPFLERNNTFDATYRAQWHGQEPLPDAYYFFDATVLTALAIEAAGAAAGAEPTRTQVRDQLRTITAAPGHDVSWTDLNDAFARVRRGEDVIYNGVTGPIAFDQFGDREDQQAAYWTISNQQFVEEHGPAAESAIANSH